MIRKLFLTFSLCLIAVGGWCANEDFTSGWTETDTGTNLSQTSSRSTYNTTSNSRNDWLSKDAGASFTADWDISFDFYVDSAGDNGDTAIFPSVVCLMDSTQAYIWGVVARDYDGTTATVFVYAYYNGSTDYDLDNSTLSVDTLYYARWRRDDDAGTNGTVYLDVYANSADRSHETNALLSLSAAITVMGKEDTTYLYAPIGYNTGGSNDDVGYIENLNLSFTPVSMGWVWVNEE